MSTHTKSALKVQRGMLTANNGGGDRLKIISPWIEDAWEDHPEAVANMERLAECWNACLSVENPQEALRMARDALKDCMGWLSCHAQGLGTREEMQATERYDSYRKALAALGAQPEEKE